MWQTTIHSLCWVTAADTTASNPAPPRPQALLLLREAGAMLQAANARGRTPQSIAARVLSGAEETGAARLRAAAEAAAAAAAADEAAAAAAAATAWRSKLWAEGDFDEEDERQSYFAQWEHRHQQPGDEYEREESDGEYAKRVRTELHAKRAAREAAEAARQARARTPERPGGSTPPRRGEDWRRVLEEEVARDRAWRERVAAGAKRSVTQERAAYLQRWAELEAVGAGGDGAGPEVAAGPQAPLRMGDIPWPAEAGKEREVGTLIFAGVEEADRKKTVFSELLRWHPDRFLTRLKGRPLAEAEAGAIMERVNAVSQHLQELKRNLG